MDFCCESLGTSVEVLQPCLDGYEVHNLISSDAEIRKKGYIAERFIKPPVNIIFTFPCPIEFSHVVIQPSVGKHKAIGLNIISGIYLNQSTSNEEKYEEVDLGKCYLKSEDHICFVNKLFRSRLPFNDLECDRLSSLNSSTFQRSMKGSMLKPLQCARKLKVSIWRTQDASLPALGKIVIYAIPSRSTDKLMIESLLKLLKPEKQDLPGDEKTCEVQQSVEQSEENGEELEKIIPHEFLDPITSAIMTFPVILPSGNVIDQSTLDKYTSAEMSWGRPPNDPFTGLPLSKDRRIIHNAALKSRIDSFLLLHGDLCSERTIGKKSAALLSQYQRDEKYDTAADSNLDRNLHNAQVNKKVLKVGVKKRIFEVDTGSSSEPNGSHCGISESFTINHKHRLDCSLDAALKSTLNSLTSFTAQPDGHTVWKTDQETLCIICNKSYKSVPLYYLPCSHVVCRECNQLQTTCGSSTKQCPHCRKSFSGSSMYRIHQ